MGVILYPLAALIVLVLGAFGFGAALPTAHVATRSRRLAARPDIILETFSQEKCDAINQLILPLGYNVYLIREDTGALRSFLSRYPKGPYAATAGDLLEAIERESQTWPFLRLTTLTGVEIAAGKFMALFYTLLGPLRLITGLRLLALLAGLVTLALAILASGHSAPV